MTEPVGVSGSVQSEPLQPEENLGQDAATNSLPSATTTILKATVLRRYLTLKPLNKLDLPHHPSYDNASSDHHVSLAHFIDNVFSEQQTIDFDEAFEKRGTWSPKSGHVMMPPLNATGSSDEIAVPISVEKRIKDVNQASWMARTSRHSDTHVKISELGDLLAKDHSRNEAAYTPSVFDAVELLRWDPEDLLRAGKLSAHAEEIHSVEMFSEFLIEYVAFPFKSLLTRRSIPNVPHDAQGRWYESTTRSRVSCVDSHDQHVHNRESLRARSVLYCSASY
jgi:hypothetical protein